MLVVDVVVVVMVVVLVVLVGVVGVVGAVVVVVVVVVELVETLSRPQIFSFSKKSVDSVLTSSKPAIRRRSSMVSLLSLVLRSPTPFLQAVLPAVLPAGKYS